MRRERILSLIAASYSVKSFQRLFSTQKVFPERRKPSKPRRIADFSLSIQASNTRLESNRFSFRYQFSYEIISICPFPKYSSNSGTALPSSSLALSASRGGEVIHMQNSLFRRP